MSPGTKSVQCICGAVVVLHSKEGGKTFCCPQCQHRLHVEPEELLRAASNRGRGQTLFQRGDGANSPNSEGVVVRKRRRTQRPKGSKTPLLLTGSVISAIFGLISLVLLINADERNYLFGLSFGNLLVVPMTLLGLAAILVLSIARDA